MEAVMTLNKTIVFACFSLSLFFSASNGNAGPFISAQCTKMVDGRTLVSMDEAVLQQAAALGYRHKVCSVKYKIKKFTKTSFDQNGNVEGVCLLELEKWQYLPSGVCR